MASEPEPRRSDTKHGVAPPRYLLPFFRQFGGPRGILGHVAARVMARANADLNLWVVDVVGVAPDDRVLDVGCGPGVAVQRAAALATAGSVMGVDASSVAVSHARRRNRAAVGGGRVRIELARASRLPAGAGEFTKVLTVNSMGHWADAEAGVREIHRVLAPGGRAVFALRIREPDAKPTDRRAYGADQGQIDDIGRLLTHVGFTDVSQVDGAPGGERHSVLLARR